MEETTTPIDKALAYFEGLGPKLKPSDFFRAETGLIARVKPDFSPREGQEALSQLVLHAVAEPGKHIIAEAGTGFGKSFAALVPAIIESILKKKRVVITTETIALQDQYFLKDLPLLQKACKLAGFNFTFAVAKGRSNFVCKAKLDEDNYDRTPELMKWGKLQQIGQHSGDRSSVPFNITEDNWRTIGADEDCERRSCPFYGEGRKGFSDCFVYSAAREFLEASIVVTNHKLFLLDTLSGAGNVLGTYDLAIVDEAHTIPEQAQATWGHEIRPRTVSKTLNLVHRMLRKAGVNHFEAGFLDTYHNLEDRMFDPFQPVLKNSVYLKNIPDHIVDMSKNAAREIVDKLIEENKMLKDFGNNSPGFQEVIEGGREKIYKLIRALKAIYGEDIDEEYKDNWIVFLESNFNSRGGRYGVLHLKPIDVAPLIKGNILDAIPTVVFMSATMKVNDSFYFMSRELGLGKDNTLEFTGDTPFNYYQQVEAYYPEDLPNPGDDDYEARLAKRIRTIIKRRKGRTLVLFTSADLMRKIHEIVVDTGVDYECYLQGEASKNALIERFKDDVSSCLFATRSFFQGIDIPGGALSTVVLTKAPFRVPSDPLFKSKCDKIKERGGNDFSGYSLPLMLMDVRQAFGRLIRTTTDTGMFCFLDSRATKMNYGRDIRKSLPKMRVVDTVEEI